MSKINAGEVDIVIYTGLRQLSELGYHRVRFHQDGVQTSFSYVDRIENGEPIWRRVEWRDGKPVLPDRRNYGNA